MNEVLAEDDTLYLTAGHFLQVPLPFVLQWIRDGEDRGSQTKSLY